MKRAFLVPVFAAAAMMLAACQPAVPAGKSVIEVRDAFIVQPANGRDISGAGMVITVKGPDRKLIKAASDVSSRVELHTMKMVNNQMKMRRVDGFVVSESTPLTLERGGDHLMMFGVKGPLAEGDEVDILLTFSDGQGAEVDILTTAEVVSPAG